MKRKKKLNLNEFGCVNVGGACRGNDALCCSGICAGKRPKKGKKDRSRCVAHGVGICTQGQDVCAQGRDATRCSLTNAACVCTVTTGDAGFCGDFGNALCVLCRSDTDCETFGFPSGAACAQTVAPHCDCSSTGDRMCVPSCA